MFGNYVHTELHAIKLSVDGSLTIRHNLLRNAGTLTVFSVSGFIAFDS